MRNGPRPKAALDRAFQLAPQAPEVRLAAGGYYYSLARDHEIEPQQNYDRALEELAVAKQGLPNSSK